MKHAYHSWPTPELHSIVPGIKNRHHATRGVDRPRIAKSPGLDASTSPETEAGAGVSVETLDSIIAVLDDEN